jgi:hypothetical protein
MGIEAANRSAQTTISPMTAQKFSMTPINPRVSTPTAAVKIRAEVRR